MPMEQRKRQHAFNCQFTHSSEGVRTMRVTAMKNGVNNRSEADLFQTDGKLPDTNAFLRSLLSLTDNTRLVCVVCRIDDEQQLPLPAVMHSQTQQTSATSAPVMQPTMSQAPPITSAQPMLQRPNTIPVMTRFSYFERYFIF